MKHCMEQKVKNETPKSALKGYKYHTESPFIGQVIQHIENTQYRQAIGHKYQEVLNEDTGELEKQKVFVLGKQKKVDRQEFYKVFNGAIKSFFKLSNSSMDMFEYIMSNIAYSNDRICLLQSDVMDKLKISRTTCYRSTLQLLESGIIAKADTEGCYFVNPTIAFKGDRITLVTQYQMNRDKELSQYEMDTVEYPIDEQDLPGMKDGYVNTEQ